MKVLSIKSLLKKRSNGLMARRTAPSHLQRETKTWWLSVVNEFELSEHHVRLLTLAGEAWDRCEQARRAIRREGLTYHDRHGAPHPRPEIAIERDSRIGFTRLVRELALDVATPDESPRPPPLKR